MERQYSAISWKSAREHVCQYYSLIESCIRYITRASQHQLSYRLNRSFELQSVLMSSDFDFSFQIIYSVISTNLHILKLRSSAYAL